MVFVFLSISVLSAIRHFSRCLNFGVLRDITPGAVFVIQLKSNVYVSLTFIGSFRCYHYFHWLSKNKLTDVSLWIWTQSVYVYKIPIYDENRSLLKLRGFLKLKFAQIWKKSDSLIFLRAGADVLYDGSGEPDYGFPDADTELTSFSQDLGSGLGPYYWNIAEC